MKPKWILTNHYYHRLLETTDSAGRQQLYRELFVEPWQAMMAMMPNASAGDNSDGLAGARAWAWLLPDQTAAISNLLAKMEAAQAWEQGEAALTKAVAAFAPWHSQIGIDTVTGWLVLADPACYNPLEPGYTGATDWLSPRFICQFWEPNSSNLARIGTVIAHEMHHLIRLRAFPWDMRHTSVADYLVVEGLAESFAIALFGADKVGHFVTCLSTDELAVARRLIGHGLHATGFNVIRSYMFGDALAAPSGFAALGGMPIYGGYAIGYQVVQAFLERSGISIEAATFLPTKEIIQGSGFF